MIRTCALAALLLVTGTALAAEIKDVELDGGVVVALSGGWNVDTKPNAAMSLPSMKDLIAGASETRIKKGGTGVLVSFMHFNSDKPTPDSTAPDAVEAQATLLRSTAGQYLRQSVEKEVSVTSLQNGPLSIAMATLTARDGQKFNVAPGYPGGCVTSATIKHGFAVHVISVASKSCDAETHGEMVAAIAAARST
ncbi:hypothetical protein [Pontixanthobacter aquaemixtae]|uniref:Uncharacterized protein n=1 Tax=Pontixanthobacter aquaemixtae TaxID=1958940 RepID=A0A844ZSW9_9SPHN|nr:hypothetical protein [Pontixanthobacter aquaemixtae]MXO90220.1 hypothetical protein [Pontixanthobacter aquaemixtae]